MLNDRHIHATQLCGDGDWSSFGHRMVLPFLNETNYKSNKYEKV